MARRLAGGPACLPSRLNAAPPLLHSPTTPYTAPHLPTHTPALSHTPTPSHTPSPSPPPHTPLIWCAACGSSSICTWSTSDSYTLRASSAYAFYFYQCGEGVDSAEECVGDAVVSAHNENATSLESTSDVTAITYGYATMREIVTEDITIYEGGTRFAFRLADQPSPSSPPSLNLEVLIPPL